MIALLLLACVAAMPFLAEAEIFGLFGCGNFLDVVDRMGQTFEGSVKMSNLLQQAPMVMLWNPNNRESHLKCPRLMLSPGGNFIVGFFDKDSVLIQYTGKMDYTMNPTASFKMTPTDPEKGDPQTDLRLTEGILSANSDGVAKMFPLYISDTEAIVMNCLNVFFGHVMSVYVLTTQDLSALDTECAISTVKEAVGITVTSAGNMTECAELYD